MAILLETLHKQDTESVAEFKDRCCQAMIKASNQLPPTSLFAVGRFDQHGNVSCLWGSFYKDELPDTTCLILGYKKEECRNTRLSF